MSKQAKCVPTLVVEVNDPEFPLTIMEDRGSHIWPIAYLASGKNTDPKRWARLFREAPAMLEALKESETAIEMLMGAFEQVLPGIGKIACQNYQIVNDGPVAARKAQSNIRSILARVEV